ncbi:FAD:protein FMN transferase [Nocardioides sp. GY 10113]|uniref:FAD:protein FMN transferase n=1 Tax=Nocardioides sp. GY 10113 TaxID=2569761 RepID=UPI0010A7BD89|nr:FAD:protein FMN transferase [Nocardioides sp. GY 10113]TIC88316.1 FAD:protein FMN transferase [Nocardioides sp. GY 10113]
MSALEWRDWSCAVRVVLADGLPATAAPVPALATRVERAVRTLMDDVALSASRFRGDSDLARVNERAGRLVPVRPLTVELVQVALEAARATHGACDPTVGRHLLAAGYVADIDELRAPGGPHGSGAPPTPPAGARPAPRADHSAVRVDPDLVRVGVPAGLALDLGATAKAWTADEAARRLHDLLGLPALVALGGDVAVSGPRTGPGTGPTEGRPWPVLVSERADEPGEVVDLLRGGVATSSTRARRWQTTDGERHHLIDPRVGRPTDGAVRTATVLGTTCVEANTFSTAALVWGDEAAARLGGRPARLVRADGTVLTTATWPHREVAA